MFVVLIVLAVALLLISVFVLGCCVEVLWTLLVEGIDEFVALMLWLGLVIVVVLFNLLVGVLNEFFCGEFFWRVGWYFMVEFLVHVEWFDLVTFEDL